MGRGTQAQSGRADSHSAVRGRSVFAGGILILNACVMAEAFRDVGELLDGISRRHRLCVSVRR